MRSRFTYIILLFTLILSPVISQASSSADADNFRSSGHDSLFCLDCHSYIKEYSDHPSIDGPGGSCMDCHELPFGITTTSSNKVDCLNCHSRHHEKTTHDAHIGVSCKACHLYGVKPVKEIENDLPVWRYKPEASKEYDPHRFITGNENTCSRCHFKSNNPGASEHILPAKSVICMLCHSSTFSTGDITSVTAIIIFLIGLLSIFIIWLAAGRSHRENEELKSPGFISVIKILIFDSLLQRKLLKVSSRRWIIHGMIFFPFVVRFLWGITALVLSLFKPEWNITWVMIDKNIPVTAFIFDITGLMILSGGCLMFLEKRALKKKLNIKGLPDSNIIFYVLLGSMIITGFITEGVRIAMTGSPEGSQFAFVGYMISRMISGYHLNGLYAYLWYLHAFITAAFIACLPFSRMFHMFTAPLSLFIKGTSRD